MRSRASLARGGTGWLAFALISLVVVACGSGSSPAVTHLKPESAVGAAEVICPIMWEWVTEVGDAFNGASHDVADLDNPEGRRNRWSEAFDEIEQLDDELIAQVMPYTGDQFLGLLVDEIVDGMEASRAELADLRELLDSSPEVDEGRHQDRTAQLIVRVEKLIDLVKPEMAGLDEDGTLIPAFQTVPSCQHALKDVDDGVPRDNG